MAPSNPSVSDAPSQPVVFGQSFQVLFQSVGARLESVPKGRLTELGIDLTRPWLPAYPVGLWFSTLEWAASVLYPHVELTEAYFRLGHDFVGGMRHTMIGRALVGLAHVLGPRRMLARISRNFRTANNYLETSLTEVSDREFRLRVSVDARLAPHMPEARLPPEYLAGVIRAGLMVSGAKDPTVTVAERDDVSPLRVTVYKILL